MANDAQTAGNGEPAAQNDLDRDSMHILPLCILPVQTPGLKRARLIKNARLQSVIEMFEDAKTGSGQIEVRDLPQQFGLGDNNSHPDMVMLRKLAALPSYDIYSLRVTLRALHIQVNSLDDLKLSAAKTEELSEHMSAVTRPLIEQIYGDAAGDVQSFGDVVKMFQDPDVQKARERLETMAKKLNIQIMEVPQFLEDFGDIFLSLSYYRQCLDDIEPIISEFLEALRELMNNYSLKNDRNLMQTCATIQSTFNEHMAAVTGRFESFDRATGNMWENMSAERFQKVRQMIQDYHTTIGGTLCALTVKMRAWKRTFPDPQFGGPQKRAEFIMIEMKQGIDNMKKFESSAPMMAGLND